MSLDKKISRREFVGTAAAVSAFTIVPRHVLGGVKYKAPSEKLNVACVGAGGMKPERPADLDPGRSMPDNGTIFVGDKGNLMCETYGEGARIFPEAKMQEYAKKRAPKTIKRIKTSHELNWAEACKGGDKASSNFEYGGKLTELALLGMLAIRLKDQKLRWDAKNLKFTNNDAANELLHIQYRDGWHL